MTRFGITDQIALAVQAVLARNGEWDSCSAFASKEEAAKYDAWAADLLSGGAIAAARSNRALGLDASDFDPPRRPPFQADRHSGEMISAPFRAR